jgi:hypothetical protein
MGNQRGASAKQTSAQTSMKALSLWQPWASLIFDGRKTIETRHWEMLYRGPLAIHAALRVEKEACRDFGYEPAGIAAGAVLCIVDVTGCVRFPDKRAPPDEYGDFAEGRFGILMRMRKRFALPIPAVGHQGVWHWDENRGLLMEEQYLERAAIKEFVGNMPREQAEREAREEVYGAESRQKTA